ncbi:hypothetical protein DJ021_08695 [Phenylobacterium hankyongense]|uniref:DUF4917 domain-containing protein n=1 Tax=Phenylobacterium hankyongense TaxID=1813876 RepID=A0A328B4C5_9CAUL|nr:DUF4917 family protein [Phenylobacterium hankyongense]RAK59878.1 hypothetical protein DJ021_08695 [Phenylobacterium hankyongense]
MEPEWISFDEAKAQTEAKRRHLLLGNGFSISKHRSFAYDRLYDEAVRGDAALEPLFAGHGTNFEAALEAAESAEDRIRIRKGLVAAIGRVHPRRGFLSPADCESCGQFLEAFAGRVREPRRGRVFTTNYDLFLYWVLMQRQTRLKLYDGFDNDGIWHEGLLDTTFVFYLHGALHHFEENIGRLKPIMRQYKLLWQEGLDLPRQVRLHIARGNFPVFVSEGTSAEKRHSIRANPYLRKVNKRFAKHLDDPEAALFTVGHSLSKVDEHITDAIGAGTAAVYIGVYKPLDGGARANELAAAWAEKRKCAGQPPLYLRLFNTAECPIWAPDGVLQPRRGGRDV